MYSLDINFLNDRPDYKPVAAKSSAKKSSGGSKDQMPIYGAVLFAFGVNAAVMGAWWWATNQNTNLAAEQATLDQELATLNTQANTIKAINAETDKVTAEYKALAGVFDQIKPWSAMLQDLSAPHSGGSANCQNRANRPQSLPRCSSNPSPRSNSRRLPGGESVSSQPHPGGCSHSGGCSHPRRSAATSKSTNFRESQYLCSS